MKKQAKGNTEKRTAAKREKREFMRKVDRAIDECGYTWKSLSYEMPVVDHSIFPVETDETRRERKEVNDLYDTVLYGLRRLYMMCKEKRYLACEIAQEKIGALTYLTGTVARTVGHAEMLTIEELIIAAFKQPVILAGLTGEALAARAIRRQESKERDRKRRAMISDILKAKKGKAVR